MASLPRVAIAGATGNLGPSILQALLKAGFPVTVLTRESSTSKIPDHPNQTVKAVDYTSRSSLVQALAGVEVVVTTLAILGVEAQKVLIDASLAAGVSRFLPTEFGADVDIPANAALPVFKTKIDTRRYLEKIAQENPNFSYTYLVTGAFLDWGIQVGWLVNSKEHTATLFNGGDSVFSTIRLSTIGQAVVAVIEHRDATKNQTVKIHDGVTTQNKVIAAIKKADGVEWKTEEKSVKELEKWAYEQLSKPDGDVPGAMFGFINVCVFDGADAFGSNMTGKTWNERLGIKELNDDEMSQAIVTAAAGK